MFGPWQLLVGPPLVLTPTFGSSADACEQQMAECAVCLLRVLQVERVSVCCKRSFVVLILWINLLTEAAHHSGLSPVPFSG